MVVSNTCPKLSYPGGPGGPAGPVQEENKTNVQIVKSKDSFFIIMCFFKFKQNSFQKKNASNKYRKISIFMML